MRILLFDGNAILYRSFYAFIKNPLRNSKGFNTSGIFGFLNTIKRVKEKFGLEYGAIAFDLPKPTFRHLEYKEYKENRPESPEELKSQMPVIKEIIQYMGIPIFEQEGFEADDIIGSLSNKIKEEVIIVSPDKDVLQLVNDRIKVYTPYRDILYDKDKILKKYGVPAERLVDYFALVGDKIDNIPGVPGIGPKKAKIIIEKYKNIEEAFEKEKSLSPYIKEFQLSKRLIEIRKDVDIDANINLLKIKEMNRDAILKIFKEFEFTSFIMELGDEKKEKIEIVEDNKNIEGSDVAFYVDDNKIYFTLNDNKISFYEIKNGKELLRKKDFNKISFDIKSLMHKTEEIEEPYVDLLIAMWLINPDRKRYTITDLFVGTGLITSMNYKPYEIPFYLKKSYEKLKDEINSLELKELFYEVEIPLIKVLYRMEKRGIAVDRKTLLRLKGELTNFINSLTLDIYKMAGVNFNLNSPKQLQEVLFNRLKLPPVKKTKTGYSTNISVLMKLINKHPIIEKLISYREYNKLVTGFIDPLIQHTIDGRIHTTFIQTGTSTGRLSSRNPNLQNIPVKGEWGQKIRNAFIAEQGYNLLSADYSQIELRIMAHLSGDKTLIEAFKKNEDIHSAVMAKLLDTSVSKITPSQRRLGKVINYGLIYGMSDYGLSQSLGIDVAEAHDFIDDYFKAFPQMAEWRKNLLKTVEEKGYTKTIMGRIRWIGTGRTGADERAALNAPVQGSAADIIKLAMVNIEKKFEKANITKGMVLQIHDELVFEIKEEQTDYAYNLIKEEMENVVSLSVPLKVEINIGKRWGDIH